MYRVPLYCIVGAVIYTSISTASAGPVCRDPTPSARVVQVEFGSIIQWPGLAAFRLKNHGTNEELYFCGGSAITKSFVVTAAHCITDMGIRKSPASEYIDGKGRKFELVLGVDNLNAVAANNVFLPEEVIMHPKFVHVTKGDDIALVKLKSAWDTTMPVAKLAQARRDASVSLRAAGFGASYSGQNVRSFVRASDNATFYVHSYRLKDTMLPEVPSDRCLAALGSATIASGQICAGLRWGGEDTCQGDSGGPLVVIDGDGCARQVGIVSWGAGCGSPGRYGVYTRLSAHEGWIRDQIREGDLFESASTINLPVLQSELLSQVQKHLRAAPLVNMSLPDSGRLRKGQSFRIGVRSPVSGRLILIDVSSGQGIYQLFPVHQSETTLKVTKDLELTVPVDQAKYFFAESASVGEIIAIVVPDPFPYDSMVASSDFLRRGISQASVQIDRDEVVEYLVNLVDQVARVTRRAQGLEGWAFGRVSYSISN
jgi:secreted trypsin-like serine protease